ncbi:MAG: DNA-binding protein [Rhodobacteraceae bacterium]|nr:DNA-binding protein [Paracoccaceae bacterium]
MLATRWQKSIRTLQRWRAEGYGPAWIHIGGSIFFRMSDVLAFEERMRRGGGDST